MATPHIAAQPGDFAPDVLMPGDPKRAAHIANTLFENPRLVTDVRGILGYTGTINGQPISVIASGMGAPSMTIYATELYRFFDVKRIIRIGTAGGMNPILKLGDVVIGTAAHTDSGMTPSRIPGVHFSHTATFSLAAAAVAAGQTASGEPAGASGAGAVHAGALFTTDHFYLARPELTEALVAHGTLAVEMEAAALYATAAAEGGQALAICSISDLLFRDEAMSAEEREVLFDRAVQLALSAFANG